MIKFLLGESRPLEFEVTYADGSDFVISEAKYELWKDNERIEEGHMLIVEHILSHVFTPEERGFYMFELSYTVGSTTKKARYHINVD